MRDGGGQEFLRFLSRTSLFLCHINKEGLAGRTKGIVTQKAGYTCKTRT